MKSTKIVFLFIGFGAVVGNFGTARGQAEPSEPNSKYKDKAPQTAMRPVEAKEKNPAEKGKLAVITEPAGAEVRVDRFDEPPVAKTPTVLELAAGEHMVQVKLSGYRTVHRVVALVASRVTMVKLKLVAKKKAASARAAKQNKARVSPYLRRKHRTQECFAPEPSERFRRLWQGSFYFQNEKPTDRFVEKLWPAAPTAASALSVSTSEYW